jgi:hypothetical protein
VSHLFFDVNPSVAVLITSEVLIALAVSPVEASVALAAAEVECQLSTSLALSLLMALSL